MGEINVVQPMRAENAVLGGEGNGGVIDPRVGLVRDSFVGMALVLDLLAKRIGPCPAGWTTLPRFADGEGPVLGPVRGVPSEKPLWDQIAEAYPEAKADRRDGLRLDWADRWAHVRSSNTSRSSG